MAPELVWLSSKDVVSCQQLGGKGSRLLKLTHLGLPVPPAFILTTTFFTTGQPNSFSNDQKAKILAAYHQLGQQIDEQEPAVAVRSSAVGEDGTLHSFAGIHDTFLGVRGNEAVLEKVLLCQSSLFSARAKAYRLTFEEVGWETAVPQMAVVVQAMVSAQTSGVMMTLNPSNGDHSKIMIESTWGLGQPVVDGTVIPDRFLIDKVTSQLIETRLAKKTKQLLPQPFPHSGVSIVSIKADKQDVPSLSTNEIQRLAEYGRYLETHFGTPQDIEFATTPNNIFILQTRPETAWSQKKRKPFGLTAQPIEQIIATLTNFEKR
jgi:phosphoenolpyruvate synthase/pyruvate phosphate dikinase